MMIIINFKTAKKSWLLLASYIIKASNFKTLPALLWNKKVWYVNHWNNLFAMWFSGMFVKNYDKQFQVVFE